MAETLNYLLNELRSDPTLAIKLYKELFDASYFVFVRPGTENSIKTLEFLTYDTHDNIQELPLFTNEKFILNNLSHEALKIQVRGQSLWERLTDIIETGVCEVAINPGQSHGIRLTKEIILGMVATYGTIN